LQNSKVSKPAITQSNHNELIMIKHLLACAATLFAFSAPVLATPDFEIVAGPEGQQMEWWTAPIDQFVFLNEATRTVSLATGESIPYDVFTDENRCSADTVCQRTSGKVAPIVIIVLGAAGGGVAGYMDSGWRGAIVGGIFGGVGGICGAVAGFAGRGMGAYYTFMGTAAGTGGSILVSRMR
jgi:hypothetical protein